MSFNEIWTRVNPISKIIFILIIAYAVISIIVLFMALNIVRFIPDSYNQVYVYLAFAIVSFLVTVFISAYHLTTLIRRRKRASDKLVDKIKT
jgi:ABC-type transport system involved in cytochrome c biogenesis permease subunit